MKALFFWIVLLLFICSSCQIGKIPCPRVKEAKLRSHYKSNSFTARANQEEPSAEQGKLFRDSRTTVQNVSLAEWDCPRPGKKRYLPKAVKENIRKNMDKIKSDTKKD
ncbi:MAG TPA: hypothetical protein PLJ60_02715 [Chryseolinea sp.]|nr:hypothetical protein [Chryseolinea sp.]